MRLFTRFRYALHMFRKEALSGAVVTEYSNIPPAAKGHFDAAFKQMDKAFEEMDKAFEALKEPSHDD